MSKPRTAEHTGRKRAGWKISAALLLLALMGLGIDASMRRTWRTVRLEAGNGGSALIVEVPPGWEGISEDDTHSYLTVTAPRPTGLLRWWDEHILKMDMRQWKFESVTIHIDERPVATSDKGRRELDMVQQALVTDDRRLYKNVKVTPLTQSDLAGFEVEASGYTGPLNTVGGTELTALLNHYDSFKHCSAIITVQAPPMPPDFLPLKPTMNEIIRRLRLVQK